MRAFGNLNWGGGLLSALIRNLSPSQKAPIYRIVVLFGGRPRRFLCRLSASVFPTPVGVKFPWLLRPERMRTLSVNGPGG
jgi:hypothetical protein